MREISTEEIRIGEHVLIDGVEYVANKADQSDVCKGCAFRDNEPCSDFIEFHWIIFNKVKKEPKYRPYNDTDEMIADWKERIGGKHWSVYEMPLIWIWDKDKVEKTLIIGFRRQEVNTADTIIHMASLLQSYTYLDGSPCGKEVAE